MSNSEFSSHLVSLWSPAPFLHLNYCFQVSQAILSQYPDLITVDCRYGHPSIAEPFLQQAGLILVILEQRYEVLQSFFLSQNDYQEKCLYLIGNYNENSDLSLERIGQLFRVDSDRVGAIPVHVTLCRDPVWSIHYCKDMAHTEHIISEAIHNLREI